MSAAPVQAHARSCSRTTTKPCTTGFSCRGGAELSTSGRTPVHFIVHKCSRRRVAQNALRSSIGLTVRTDTAFMQARSTAAQPAFRNCVVQRAGASTASVSDASPAPGQLKKSASLRKFLLGNSVQTYTVESFEKLDAGLLAQPPTDIRWECSRRSAEP